MKNAERRMKCVLRRKHSTFNILHSAFAKRVACRMRSTKETTEGQTMNLPLCSCQGAQAPPQRREAERAEKLRKSFRRRGSRNAKEAEGNEGAHPRKGRTAGQAASPPRTQFHSPFPVAMTKGSHLFPSRTQKLSPSVPKVLGWTRPGSIGRRRIPIKPASQRCGFYHA